MRERQAKTMSKCRTCRNRPVPVEGDACRVCKRRQKTGQLGALRPAVTIPATRSGLGGTRRGQSTRRTW